MFYSILRGDGLWYPWGGGGRYFSDCNLVTETSIAILLEVSELSHRMLHAIVKIVLPLVVQKNSSLNGW